jgi:hypothetical protein
MKLKPFGEPEFSGDSLSAVIASLDSLSYREESILDKRATNGPRRKRWEEIQDIIQRLNELDDK